MMGCIVNSEFLRDVALHPADGQAYAGMAGRPTFHAEIGRELAQLREGKGWSQRRAVDIARRKGLPLGLGALRFLGRWQNEASGRRRAKDALRVVWVIIP